MVMYTLREQYQHKVSLLETTIPGHLSNFNIVEVLGNDPRSCACKARILPLNYTPLV